MATSGEGRSSGCAIVAVVEPADVRRHDNPPARRRHDRARDRRVLLQCQVRSGLHVVSDIRGQYSMQPRGVGHDEVIEALASNRADDALDVGFCHGDRGAVPTV